MREHCHPAPIYHPWRVLGRHWPHVNVKYTSDLPLGRLGDTNGLDEIRLRDRLLQVERRCALTHELVHLEHGHTGACSPANEDAVNRETARRLITWDALVQALRWARSERELAAELWVTIPILRARTSNLHADELLELAHVFHDVHHDMPHLENPHG
ncbi:hypothetical protein GCM10009592_28270 [Brachybacterium rhamnosum]|uniref:ImmA/IrrE family metallo-endopeptidase n=1 Tax=Brachybacterium rhamnosum TaxID=173361 RepID=A0ABW4Q080_9MICO